VADKVDAPSGLSFMVAERLHDGYYVIALKTARRGMPEFRAAFRDETMDVSPIALD
jgi:hypothetical protein